MRTIDALREHVGAKTREATDFASLCKHCEGAWPQVVAQILGERRHDADAARLLGSIAEPASRQPTLDRRLPPPHPLDADWRFTRDSAERILDSLLEAAGRTGAILLVCMPTVALAARDRGLQARIAIASRRGDPVDDALRTAIPDARFTELDATRIIRFAAIGIDPPWYDDIALPIVARCIDLAETDAAILLCVPDRFTMPSDAACIASVVSSPAALGFVAAEVAMHVRYETPFFELRALGALGIANVSPCWRTGILAKCSMASPSRPRIAPAPRAARAWRETVCDGSRIWFRSDALTRREDPAAILVSTSISRRDPMRARADLWTSGNTVGIGIGPLDAETLALAIARPVEGEWSGDLADALAAERNASDRSIIRR